MTSQRVYFFLLLSIAILTDIGAQKTETKTNPDAAYTPLILKLNEDGSNYLRLLTWHQFWLSSSNLSQSNPGREITPSIRRSRMAIVAKLSSKLLIWTHVGMNDLSPQNQSPLGGSGYNTPQIFVHGAWGEVQVNDYLQVGAGLHYWNGLTRLASASTITFMTLDQSRPFASWHALGVTDQFGRHLGVYLKGQIKKIDYRVAINAPSWNGLAGGQDYGVKNSKLLYRGVRQPDSAGRTIANTIFEGYFRYNFLDPESNLLPFQTGTYLGEKSVFGVGAGFFLHPGGMFDPETEMHPNVHHFAVDAFVDKPIGNGNTINAYLALQRFDFGENYVSRWVGTGQNIYGQLGYLFRKSRLMPYSAFQFGDYDGLEKPVSTLDIGVNYFINNHNAKLTLEYHQIKGDIREVGIDSPSDKLVQLRLQFQIFL